jgi:hypothetical protein
MTDLDRVASGTRTHGEIVATGQKRIAVLAIEDDASVTELLCNVLMRG